MKFQKISASAIIEVILDLTPLAIHSKGIAAKSELGIFKACYVKPGDLNGHIIILEEMHMEEIWPKDVI